MHIVSVAVDSRLEVCHLAEDVFLDRDCHEEPIEDDHGDEPVSPIVDQDHEWEILRRVIDVVDVVLLHALRLVCCVVREEIRVVEVPELGILATVQRQVEKDQSLKESLVEYRLADVEPGSRLQSIQPQVDEGGDAAEVHDYVGDAQEDCERVEVDHVAEVAAQRSHHIVCVYHAGVINVFQFEWLRLQLYCGVHAAHLADQDQD